ncbi:MAG: energy-coupling factor ABC transporter ATP-binding protein [Solobacterium sp.]|jgi:cobalt/nickel transport system ATP-binding protein|nr:energy-coupling factor ABC transporter ATP-binding protein [Solobacterium sp.]MCH4206150.1 energy-coupling factor ABC transporter ATP-binding protein [Solobacterium sp.]MCH4227616.1 energy-coupling factor ABC transporter ATP-binding protein [Solobacterium sp.]MCH4282584.1 energy-coupling factor ABC transporter ATP-binding protein [Solobacterium sp.]
MIELKNISYAYGTRLVLDHISVRFPEGKCTCIDGPNGCGKSTLFRILSGLIFPDTGSYLLDGEEITQKKLKQKAYMHAFYQKIGYVFQDSEAQLFTRSAEDEIAFGLYQLAYDPARIHEITEKYISLMDLNEVRHQAPFTLSTGEKKRTALAAVLAMDPKIIILDEPTASLDEDGQTWLIAFLQQLKKEKKTIILSSHQPEVIAALADHTIQINKHHQIVPNPENKA